MSNDEDTSKPGVTARVTHGLVGSSHVGLGPWIRRGKIFDPADQCSKTWWCTVISTVG